MQPIIVAEYEKEAEEKFGPKGGAATKDDGGVIDVEVEAKKTDNNQQNGWTLESGSTFIADTHPESESQDLH